MSLINEALKKAQRDRLAEAGGAASSAAGGPSGRRTKNTSTQVVVLIAAAAVVLFVLAVYGAVLVLNRAPSVKPPIAITQPLAPKSAAGPATSAPMIVIPPLVPVSAPPIVVATPPSAPPTESAQPSTPQPAAAQIPNAPPPEPAAAKAAQPITDKFDARLQTLVDSWHVTGIRALGADSKLMMNEKVYRVGDVLDRASGLKLTKVTSEELTFTDRDNVIYVKKF